MTNKRIKKLTALMESEGVEGIAIIAGYDLKYFTGLDFHLSERPAILILNNKGQGSFIFPEFEKDKVNQSQIQLDAFPYTEDSQTWPEVTKLALEKVESLKSRIAVSPTAMRFLEINLLQSASENIKIVSGESIFKDIYILKDNEEIKYMRKAVEIAQNALLKTLPDIKIGKTEKEIANLLVVNLLNGGSEPVLPFNPIVASGPNSANPHATPGDRKLQAGDMLIIDWGARVNGYVSDITRTFAISQIPPDFDKISEIVLAANRSGRETAAPGIEANQVDAAARTVIEKANYGEYFLHRTGHGIGLNAHEDPYISSTSTTVLQEGMTFTVEPGIYIKDKGGIRIEDNVVITANGCETLTSLPREIRVI